MTTPIQAAIEALPRYDLDHTYEGGSMWSHPDGDYFKADDVLAALQAAPAQECKWPMCLPEHEQVKLADDVMSMLSGEAPAPGSIDTPIPTWQERLGKFFNAEEARYDPHHRAMCAEIADLRAHIAQVQANSDDIAAHLGAMTKTATALRAQLAQRAASVDALVTGVPSMIVSQAGLNVAKQLDYYVNTRCDVDAIYVAMRNAEMKLAAPAPIADEVANREAEQRERMNARFAGRPTTPATADFDLPAPNDASKASAPDAPAEGGNQWRGSLAQVVWDVPLPERSDKYRSGFVDAKQAVLQALRDAGFDRAAAAPDAPAGDFPPLPEPDKIHHDELHGEAHYWDDDSMRAYVLADRAGRAAAAPAGKGDIADPVFRNWCSQNGMWAISSERKAFDEAVAIGIARAAAAPAGHAEPVAYALFEKNGNPRVWFGDYAMATSWALVHGFAPSDLVPLVAAPVAAEPILLRKCTHNGVKAGMSCPFCSLAPVAAEPAAKA